LKPTGSICAIVTPFDGDDRVDLAAFAGLVAWHRESGTQGLVVAGSTGESGALEEHEYEALLDIALVHAGAGMPVVAGCGAPATHKALRLARAAKRAGAAALLAVTPYYARPTQAGLERHFRSIADTVGLPVILYNVPTRTGCDLLPDTVARLVGHECIVGIKEARPEPERMAALLALRCDGFQVLSGDDPTACRAMLAGADGTISVAANVLPRTFRTLCDLARARDPRAGGIDADLAPLYRLLGVEPNPIPVKWLLARAGRIGPALRLPLLGLSEACVPEAEAEWERLRRLALD
jgi:4-hydroxy-tetrahydrodipicolinate synthase